MERHSRDAGFHSPEPDGAAMSRIPDRRTRAGRIVDALAELLIAPLLGASESLPPSLLAVFPELAEARWRRGGLPPRIGGWALFVPTVSAITLWGTVFLAPRQGLHPALLLHELGYVRQFRSDVTFPVRYLWDSVRRGYLRNRYELDAEAFARGLLHERAALAAELGSGRAPRPTR